MLAFLSIGRPRLLPWTISPRSTRPRVDVARSPPGLIDGSPALLDELDAGNSAHGRRRSAPAAARSGRHQLTSQWTESSRASRRPEDEPLAHEMAVGLDGLLSCSW